MMESSDPKGIYRQIAGRLSTLILHAGTFLCDRSLSGVSPNLRFSKKLP